MEDSFKAEIAQIRAVSVLLELGDKDVIRNGGCSGN